MRSFRGLAVGLCLLTLSAGAVWAQAAPPPPDRVAMMRDRARMPSAPEMSVRMLRSWITADPALADRREAALALVTRAEASLADGDRDQAARLLAQARATADNIAWSPAAEYAGSLSFRPVAGIVDAGAPLRLRVSQSYSASAPADARVRISAVDPNGATVQLGEQPLVGHDADAPLSFLAPTALQGRRNLVVEVLSGADVAARSSAEIVLVSNLAQREADTRRRLAAVTAGPDAEATVLYPFDLVRTVNSGARDLERADFQRRLARSEAVLAALEQGRDIVVRGVGDQDRARHFPASGEIMPYRIYVPSWWTPEYSLPIVLALHGGGSDENEMLNYNDGRFGKLAELYGYIVVSPFGYRPVGTWGNPVRLPAVYGSDTREGRDLGDAATQRMRALSEQDALETLDLVAAEYGADTTRAFVTGHSMGGGGTWYLAHKYPERWAGAAASAGPFFTDGYDFDRLRNMGILIAQGDDDPLSLDSQRRLAADLLMRGQGVTYLETPGANHGNSFGLSLPGIFDFFERQKPSTGTPSRLMHPAP